MKKTKELSEKVREGASAILETEIIEIENAVAEKNKNSEIHRLTIPYLHLQNALGQYLSKKEIKEFDSKYTNTLKKYWESTKK